MMDHVGLSVSDFERSKSFFERALAPLGYKCLKEYPGAAGFGADRPDFWIGQSAKLGATHVAFLAADRTIVEKFYTAAIAAGGRDNGKPGIRKEYHPTYYGAFVLDLRSIVARIIVKLCARGMDLRGSSGDSGGISVSHFRFGIRHQAYMHCTGMGVPLLNQKKKRPLAPKPLRSGCPGGPFLPS